MSVHTMVISGDLLTDTGLVPGAVVIEGGRIGRILSSDELESIDVIDGEALHAPIVAPGFIDLQVNGSFGHDAAQPGAIREIAARLPSTGVTAFLPTIISSLTEQYAHLPDELEAARQSPGGAAALGLHLEGPLLSPVRAGAHPRAAIEAADVAVLAPLLARDALRLVTLAPERPEAADWISRLRAAGVVVSLGHTDASYDELRRGIDAGATLVTHLYNAMSPFHHREPGAVGAALDDDRVAVGLIADGVHCHPAALRLALRAKGARGVVLVTDAMAAAGLGPGRYPLGGVEVIVDATSARLADGTLAGSTLTMDRSVRELVRMTGAALADALRIASEVPARILGLATKGRIAVGCDADLVLLDRSLDVTAAVVGGRVAYRRAA